LLELVEDGVGRLTAARHLAPASIRAAAGIAIDRISNGKIAEEWTEYDALGLMRSSDERPRRPPRSRRNILEWPALPILKYAATIRI
jgi:hypothetical protein